jgi:gliding motility-associated-like protein
MKPYLLFLISLLLIIETNCSFSQTDNYILIDQEDYNHQNVVPYVITAAVQLYNEFPGNECPPEGTRALLLNFVDDYLGIALDRSIDVCIGAEYYMSWIMGNCHLQHNNDNSFVQPSIRVVIEDDNGDVLFDDSWMEMDTWEYIQTTRFIPTTSVIHYKLYTLTPGDGWGNDLTFDDLRLYQNNPYYDFTLDYCSTDAPVNLTDELLTLNQTGSWSGPTVLADENAGIFDPSINTTGLYIFTPNVAPVCPDTTSNFQMNIGVSPTLDIVDDITTCGFYELPEITGENLSGNQAYYTQPNGTGTSYAIGNTVTESLLLYIYDASEATSVCYGEQSFQLIINDAPNAGNNHTGSYCIPTNEIMNLSTLIGIHDSNGEWHEISVTQSNQFDETTSELTIDDTFDGTYDFIYIVPEIGDCESDTSFISITVFETPDILISSNSTSGCSPEAIEFNSGTTSNSNFTYEWSISNGTSSTDKNPSILFTTDGCFNVTLTVSNTGECSQTINESDFICIYPRPESVFSIDQDSITVATPLVTGDNLSSGADSYTWLFGDGQISSETDLHHSYADQPGGWYAITLVAQTEFGCSDTSIQEIFLYNQFTLEIANVFTPNDDGVNDFFQIKIAGIEELEWVVLNRWGNLITSGKNNFPTNETIVKLWDGTVDGAESSDGVYFYKINYIDFLSKKDQAHGTVTLIRNKQ